MSRCARRALVAPLAIQCPRDDALSYDLTRRGSVENVEGLMAGALDGMAANGPDIENTPDDLHRASCWIG